jgi:hypothetical protein
MLRLLAVTPLALLAFTPVASAQVGGSYQDSCENIRQRGPYLVAECRTVNGDYMRSSIDVRGCRGGVSNSNGRLTCGRGGYGGGRGYGYGGGGYRPRWQQPGDED